MNNIVCDKCGYNFTLNKNDFSVISKGDIEVQYFCCPACATKYHVCTTNTEMRELIKKRLEIQDRIVTGSTRPLPSGTVQNLRHKLNKIIAKQNKLMSCLRKQGKKILNGDDEQ